jgi:hypothetical protein
MKPLTSSAPNAFPDHGRFPSEVRDLPLHELRSEAAALEQSHARGHARDDRAGLELFRRAIAERDEAARHAVVELYRGVLIAQAGRHVLRSLVTEDDGFCVDRAFERFWCATRSGRIQQFDDLASILKYLKLCLGSVLLDEARARRRRRWLSVDEVSTGGCVSADSAVQVIGRLAVRELWQAISRELTDPNERLIAHLTFVAGLSPREILTRHPDKFENASDVYRTKRNMVERLRRSPANRRWLTAPSS